MMQDTTVTGTSLDVTAENRRKLAALFPEAVVDGNLDLSALKRALGDHAVLADSERYALTWAGKGDSYRVLQAPTTATLRPQRDESIHFDVAQHVFIEGENLEALKVIQKSYFGRVKLIYIDPPYNTGSDRFIYPDRFQESKEDYLKRINDLADDGLLMREGFFHKNNKENGRFHSNWLSMMLPRLYIARNLLQQDGVILVSIDDNEAANLKLVMDEVFGAENFIAQLVWEKGRKNDAKLFSVGHEYMLVYARSVSFLRSVPTIWREAKPGAKEIIEKWRELKVEVGEKNYEAQQSGLREWYASLPAGNPSKKLSRYKWVDKWGPWRDRDISWPGGGGPRYDVPHDKTKVPVKVPERGWGFASPEEMQRQIGLGLVVFREDHTEPPFRKAHLIPVPEELDVEDALEAEEEETDPTESEEIGLQVMGSVLYKQSQVAVKYLRKLLGGKLFENPKDHEVLARLIGYCMGNDQEGMVLDFFAGSASTVEAVTSLNQKDGGKRQVIAIQLPEATQAGSAAHKRGLATIADVSRERIKRVLVNAPAEPPVGIRSFILAPSTFRQWRGDGIEDEKTLADQIQMFTTTSKEGATSEDILFELLLRFGQSLTSVVERIPLEESTAYATANRTLVFVLQPITLESIHTLVALKPKQLVVLDSVFQNSDELKSNLDLQCRDAEIRFMCL